MTQIAVPFPTQRIVRASMGFSAIVDIDGVANPKTGGFHVVQDAIDAGHKSIFVRDGSYPYFTLAQNNTTIVGESWSVIINEDSANHAVSLGVYSNCYLSNFQVVTAAGGGNNFDGISNGSNNFNTFERIYVSQSDRRGIVPSADCLIINCRIESCDDRGIYCEGTRAKIIGNKVSSCSGIGIALDSGSADDSIAMGNNTFSNSGGGIIVGTNDEDCIIVGNRCSDNITDNSGTSTVTGNDTS